MAPQAVSVFRPAGADGRYEVVHDRIVLRGGPSVKEKIVQVFKRGDVVHGSPFEIDRLPWLRASEACLEEHKIVVPKDVEGCWLLIEGRTLGLGQLLRRLPELVAAPPAAPRQQPSGESAAKAEEAAVAIPATPTGPPGQFVVVHDKIVRRKGPAVDATPIGVHLKGQLFGGVPHVYGDVPWLCLDGDKGWMMMDGASVGLGKLLSPAADIAEDIVLWAEQQRKTEGGKSVVWTATTEGELLQIAAAARSQVEPLNNWCEHSAVLRRLEQAGYIVSEDFTLGAEGVALKVLRYLLRRRAGVLVLAEELPESGPAWRDESFQAFLREAIEPQAPFHCRVFMPEERPQRLLVLLHGSMVRGDDLVAEAETLRKLMPETAVALPEAPIVADETHGLRVWWSLPAVTDAGVSSDAPESAWWEAPSRIVQRLVATLAWLATRVRGAPVVLGGFSQGAILAAQSLSALKDDLQPIGLLILSGLVSAFELPRGVRCLAIHGDRDERIKLEMAREAATQDPMVKAGLELQVIPDLGHEISDSVLDRMMSFCDEVKPVERAVATREDDSWVQEANQAKLLRWVKRISQMITMFDDARFMATILVPDMAGLDSSCPTVGNGLVRYALHDAGPDSRGTVVLLHGKIADIQRDTKALVEAYSRLRLSVCVVDYRQKFSQFCVDATIVLEELESITNHSSSPVIIHACGCAAIHGIHMAIASQSYPAFLRRRLRLLVLDGGIGNFKSLPPMPTGCIAVDPIGNDHKLKYVGIPLCILGGDDACCGQVHKQTGHLAVLTKSAEMLLQDNLLPSLVVSPGTALMAGTGDARLNPELYQAATEALDQTRTIASKVTQAFVTDVLSSADINPGMDASNFKVQDLVEICKAALQEAQKKRNLNHLWDLRVMPEPERGEQLYKFILSCCEPALTKHGGFEPGMRGFQQFEGVAATLSGANPELNEARAQLLEAFSLQRLDVQVQQLERDSHSTLGVKLSQCHEILDNAMVEWNSKSLWAEVVSQALANGGTPAAAQDVFRGLSNTMNISHARRLGCKGTDLEATQRMEAAFRFWTQHDPSLRAKASQVQKDAITFMHKLSDECSSQKAALKPDGAAENVTHLSASRDTAPAIPNGAAKEAKATKASQRGEDVQVAIEHATDGGAATVTVPSTASVLDVRRALLELLGETRLSQVKLVKRLAAGTGFRTLQDDEPLGTRRALLMLGCSLAGASKEAAPSGVEAAPDAEVLVEASPAPIVQIVAEEVQVTVHIERELGLSSCMTMPAGSKVRDIKEQMAREDPTGMLSAGDLRLRLPGEGRELGDEEPVTAAMADLDVC